MRYEAKTITEIGIVTATNIVPTTQVSKEVEVTEPESVSSILAQLGSINVSRDTPDRMGTDLKYIKQA